MKQKVKFQKVRENEGGQDYAEWMENPHVVGGGNGGSGETTQPHETTQANPDHLAESAGYWAVSEATKEVQGRVRLMLERAKQVLTDQQYSAFVLVDLKKLKLRDAAKVMEINYQRVDQLVKRARLKLHRVYEGTANG